MTELIRSLLLVLRIGASSTSDPKQPVYDTPREEPSIEEYKKLIYEAGGTAVYDAEGVDIMLADAYPVELAAKLIGPKVSDEDNQDDK